MIISRLNSSNFTSTTISPFVSCAITHASNNSVMMRVARTIITGRAPHSLPQVSINSYTACSEATLGLRTKVFLVVIPMRKRKFKITTDTVVRDKEELKIGLIHSGTPAYTPGTMSTLRPKIIAIPTTSILRASSIRDVMIWNPTKIMKLTANTNVAPITGVGMMTNMVANLGRKARAHISRPTDQAILRLVAPVARDRATLLDEVDCPIPPRSPAPMQLAASASKPPLTEFISI